MSEFRTACQILVWLGQTPQLLHRHGGSYCRSFIYLSNGARPNVATSPAPLLLPSQGSKVTILSQLSRRIEGRHRTSGQ
ncbi:hypothetical protein MPTK1_1g11170 [Marchantia polymorpha subsp. ruderalis]|uniref:Uncharacterized protein n=2 Tax=Marchantia polymorpha TaxID=3197 RepID=A0AAF6ANX5_MARPO|nr:hypothetical protein MARPO_0014s0110 [Marchantia polymorpha]BBM98145.1 hypothetical protein Mp_1g11170 [Marchantia polymorpha subsp. ruderalis]|eukprot:PTQ45580.1 hypothetical protein MARPO_0014s0110 [Marchantia polymorpha]